MERTGAKAIIVALFVTGFSMVESPASELFSTQLLVRIIQVLVSIPCLSCVTSGPHMYPVLLKCLGMELYDMLVHDGLALTIHRGCLNTQDNTHLQS